jgi:hypothetical protein
MVKILAKNICEKWQKNNGENNNYTSFIIFNNTKLIKPRVIMSSHLKKSISQGCGHLSYQTPPKLYSRVALA